MVRDYSVCSAEHRPLVTKPRTGLQTFLPLAPWRFHRQRRHKVVKPRVRKFHPQSEETEKDQVPLCASATRLSRSLVQATGYVCPSRAMIEVSSTTPQKTDTALVLVRDRVVHMLKQQKNTHQHRACSGGRHSHSRWPAQHQHRGKHSRPRAHSYTARSRGERARPGLLSQQPPRRSASKLVQHH